MRQDGREIERKYLLRALPAGVTEHRSLEIDQGYIPGTQIRERIRRIVSVEAIQYVRTVKVGTGMDRFEFEEETTAAFFEAMWPLTLGKRVRKRRYLVPAGEVVWEVDEFLDRELVLAEVELERVDQVVEVIPAVAAVLEREVTGEVGYGNYQLAR